MRYLPVLFSLVALFAASSCSQESREEEVDYENMVMAELEEEELMTDQERDRKVIAGDLPDPRERIILEPKEAF